MAMMIRQLTLCAGAACLAVMAASVTPISLAASPAAERPDRPLPATVSALRLGAPVTAQVSTAALQSRRAQIDPALKGAKGRQHVLVRLRSPSAGEIDAQGPSDRISQRERVRGEQSAFVRRAAGRAPGARLQTSVQTVLNGVVMDVDAEQIAALANDPDVARISRVIDYQMDLSETVPYIGATAVQNAGYDGRGVRVAVLDSGIDYTHAAFGGPGTVEAFNNNDPTIIETGTFPTAKVVGGYDFVGSNWPNDVLAPDPDPLDDGPGGGHGTHVADIIGGKAGVAPGVDLYAVKVCSSVSTSCSGVALIQGMEFAVDPDGDGDTSDHVDIINMSLGSNFGQPFDDDLSLAVNTATRVGVMTVASAGNGGDKPYIVGTPSAALTALSVAQTAVPSDSLQYITVGTANYPAVFQDWSAPLTTTITGPVAYGASYGSANGCSVGAGGVNDVSPGSEPYAPGSLAGLVVLVDRGVCNFSIKIFNIQRGGGVAGIIGLVDSSAPFNGSFGAGGPYTIPGYMISLADANAIRGMLGSAATIDPDNILPLVMTMVGSSSRGPRNPDSFIKPEIGAPGASVSAIAGSGTGTGPFGGTSGASPMVAGSAALLLDAYPRLRPYEVKARLMNNGYTDIETDPFIGLAPISRIGGGEVRVDRALKAPAAAWDDETKVGALSFGFEDVSRDYVTLEKKVRVRNYGWRPVTYRIKPTFRFQDDIDTGAVSVDAPWKIRVYPKRDETFTVRMTVRGDLLRGNYMNSGSQAANPAVLTLNEYDGYLELDDGKSPIHLAWHILPRKAADVAISGKARFVEGGITPVPLYNRGVGTAQNDAYSLLAISPNLPEGAEGAQSPTPDIRAVGVNTFLTSSCDAGFIWAFAVNTWERQTNLIPVVHLVYLDTNQDGNYDYAVINSDFSGPFGFSDGRELAWAVDLATGSASAYFYAEHSTNTGNTALYVCGEQVGLTSADLLNTNVDMAVEAYDNYFGGPGDFVDGLTVTPYGERYFGLVGDLPGKSSGQMDVYDFGAFPGNTDELGVMLFTNGDRGSGAHGGATQCSEALLVCDDVTKYCANKQAKRRGGKHAYDYDRKGGGDHRRGRGHGDDDWRGHDHDWGDDEGNRNGC
jgi:subtilisin family serine protease